MENGAGGEEEFLIQAPITNQTQALQPFWDSACHCQQAHPFHSLFLTHKPLLNLPFITLQWLTTGVSVLHATTPARVITGAVTEPERGVCLALLVQGKCGHRG